MKYISHDWSGLGLHSRLGLCALAILLFLAQTMPTTASAQGALITKMVQLAQKPLELKLVPGEAALRTYLWNTTGTQLLRVPTGANIPSLCETSVVTCGPYSNPPPITINPNDFNNRSFATSNGIWAMQTVAVYKIGSSDFEVLARAFNPGIVGDPTIGCDTYNTRTNEFDPSNRYCNFQSTIGSWEDQWAYFRVGPALPLELTISVITERPVAGKPVRFGVGWNQAGNVKPEAPQVPPGNLKLYDGSREVCAGSEYIWSTGHLQCPAWPVFFYPGDHTISVQYSGDVLHDPATARVALSIATQPAGSVLQINGISDHSSGTSVQPFTGGIGPATRTMRRIKLSSQSLLGSQLLAIGNDGHLYHQAAFNGAFDGFAEIGIASEAAIDTFIDGSAQVVAIGADGNVYHRVRNIKGAWTTWAPLGFKAQDVAMTAMDPGAHVIAIDDNGGAFHTIRNGDGSWTGWTHIPGPDASAIVAVATAAASFLQDGELQVALITSNGTVRMGTRHASGQWSPFTDLALPGGLGATAIAMTEGIDSELHLVIVSANGNVYHRGPDRIFNLVAGQPIAGASLAIGGDPAAPHTGVIYVIKSADSALKPK